MIGPILKVCNMCQAPRIMDWNTMPLMPTTQLPRLPDHQSDNTGDGIPVDGHPPQPADGQHGPQPGNQMIVAGDKNKTKIYGETITTDPSSKIGAISLRELIFETPNKIDHPEHIASKAISTYAE